MRRICIGIAWYLLFQITFNYLFSTWFTSFEPSRIFSIIVPIVLTIIGVSLGILPGTKHKQEQEPINQKKSTIIIRGVLSILGLLLMLYQFPMCFVMGMGAGTPPAEWFVIILSMLCLFVAGFGIILHKRWSWYLAVIVIPIFSIGSIVFGLRTHTLDQDFFIIFFPLFILGFILIPKVKEQFR